MDSLQDILNLKEIVGIETEFHPIWFYFVRKY